MTGGNDAVAQLVARMDDLERAMFADALKRFASAKSEGWKTRHLLNFERWFRARRGLPPVAT